MKIAPEGNAKDKLHIPYSNLTIKCKQKFPEIKFLVISTPENDNSLKKTILKLYILLYWVKFYLQITCFDSNTQNSRNRKFYKLRKKSIGDIIRQDEGLQRFLYLIDKKNGISSSYITIDMQCPIIHTCFYVLFTRKLLL